MWLEAVVVLVECDVQLTSQGHTSSRKAGEGKICCAFLVVIMLCVRKTIQCICQFEDMVEVCMSEIKNE